MEGNQAHPDACGGVCWDLLHCAHLWPEQRQSTRGVNSLPCNLASVQLLTSRLPCRVHAQNASPTAAANDVTLGLVATGFAVLAQTYAFSHVSLAQFNPAISLGLLLTKSVTWVDSLITMAMQCLAGLLAGFTMASIADHVVAPMPPADDFSSNITAAAVELMFTFAVVLVALNSLRDMPNSYHGIAVGLLIVAGMYTAKPYSGAGTCLCVRVCSCVCVRVWVGVGVGVSPCALS